LGSFFHGKKICIKLEKTIWATFWATFSETHPVTLLACDPKHFFAGETFFQIFIANTGDNPDISEAVRRSGERLPRGRQKILLTIRYWNN
jgi:hypothetical protein